MGGLVIVDLDRIAIKSAIARKVGVESRADFATNLPLEANARSGVVRSEQVEARELAPAGARACQPATVCMVVVLGRSRASVQANACNPRQHSNRRGRVSGTRKRRATGTLSKSPTRYGVEGARHPGSHSCTPRLDSRAAGDLLGSRTYLRSTLQSVI